jgi:CRISPR-associated protein (TIGR02584 family)
MKMSDKKIVLVVGMGTSPAVMTETVWALAHQERQVTGTY